MSRNLAVHARASRVLCTPPPTPPHPLSFRSPSLFFSSTRPSLCLLDTDALKKLRCRIYDAMFYSYLSSFYQFRAKVALAELQLGHKQRGAFLIGQLLQRYPSYPEMLLAGAAVSAGDLCHRRLLSLCCTFQGKSRPTGVRDDKDPRADRARCPQCEFPCLRCDDAHGSTAIIFSLRLLAHGEQRCIRSETLEAWLAVKETVNDCTQLLPPSAVCVHAHMHACDPM